MNAWWKLHDLLPCRVKPSASTPMWHNPMFLINIKPFYFSTWSQRGETTLGHLYNGGLFLIFEHIQLKYNLPNQTFFQYLQLKEVIQKSIGSCTLTNCNSHIYQTIESVKPNKILSQIYTFSISSETDIVAAIQQWTKDMGTDQMINWQEVCNNIYSMSCNSNDSI